MSMKNPDTSEWCKFSSPSPHRAHNNFPSPGFVVENAHWRGECTVSRKALRAASRTHTLFTTLRLPAWHGWREHAHTHTHPSGLAPIRSAYVVRTVNSAQRMQNRSGNGNWSTVESAVRRKRATRKRRNNNFNASNRSPASRCILQIYYPREMDAILGEIVSTFCSRWNDDCCRRWQRHSSCYSKGALWVD